MRINWKVRLKNKTWVLAMLSAIVAFVYQILGMFEIVAPISEDMVMQFIGIILNTLVALGVIMDPSTKGLDDSSRALSYNTPAENVKTEL